MSEFFKLYFQLSHAVDVKIGSRQRRCLREFIAEHGVGNGLTMDAMLTDMRTAMTAWCELGLGRHVVEKLLEKVDVSIVILVVGLNVIKEKLNYEDREK